MSESGYAATTRAMFQPAMLAVSVETATRGAASPKFSPIIQYRSRDLLFPWSFQPGVKVEWYGAADLEMAEVGLCGVE